MDNDNMRSSAAKQCFSVRYAKESDARAIFLIVSASMKSYSALSQIPDNVLDASTESEDDVRSIIEKQRVYVADDCEGVVAGTFRLISPNMEAYKAREQELLQAIADSDGNDDVVIYLRDIKNIKILPANLRVKADETLMEMLASQFGKENVKFITKPIENRSKID